MSPAEARKLWVERLESGTVIQGRRHLGWPDGRRCCLGVACDIAVEEGVIESYDITDGVLSRYPKVVEFFGLQNPHASFGDVSYVGQLSNMNDSGRSFAEIAAVIRAEPKGLFHV